jgi:response regulator NasT
MSDSKKMVRVLLLDEDRARGALIAQALSDSGADFDIKRPDVNINLIKLVESFQPDVIIIEVDSPSRDTLEHLSIINEHNPKPVVMFSSDHDSSLIGKAIRSGVSAYVVDGLAHNRVLGILELAIARFREYQALKDELLQTKNQLADRKVIEKAKGLLIKHKGMDEESAFKAMRKMAMDKSQSLSDVAHNIVSVMALLA